MLRKGHVKLEIMQGSQKKGKNIKSHSVFTGKKKKNKAINQYQNIEKFMTKINYKENKRNLRSPVVLEVIIKQVQDPTTPLETCRPRAELDSQMKFQAQIST